MSPTKDGAESGSTEPGLGDGSSTPGPTPAAARPGLRNVGAALGRVGARVVYWAPVFAALALFAQVAFLGLRPALSEARRLADAADVLQARWETDCGLYDAYELQVRVRQDPIFRERQRRIRCAIYATEGTVADAGPATGLDTVRETGLDTVRETGLDTVRETGLDAVPSSASGDASGT